MGDWPLLTVNIIELNLFKPSTRPRAGVAYWVGKGVKDESVLPTGSIEIHRGNYPSRAEVAELLSSVNYLISFDAFSAINIEAVLCGTPVLIAGSHPRMSRDDIMAHNWTPFGVAWSQDELDEARREVHLAYDHYLSLLPVFGQRVDKFITDTLNIFS